MLLLRRISQRVPVNFSLARSFTYARHGPIVPLHDFNNFGPEVSDSLAMATAAQREYGASRQCEPDVLTFLCASGGWWGWLVVMLTYTSNALWREIPCPLTRSHHCFGMGKLLLASPCETSKMSRRMPGVLKWSSSSPLAVQCR
jgi:hypothetical protein